MVETQKVTLPPIPAKRYFTIGEVSELCGVKPHVLRYWEQEFTQLKPVKRRGNRRYYQHHEVLLIRKIRELLYEQGFTISGARNRLEGVDEKADKSRAATEVSNVTAANNSQALLADVSALPVVDVAALRLQIQQILQLLKAPV
ncbi:MerR family transcriptional regulator [Methylophilus medardicus]|uniref:MerR family transcriptional regulator n=1 Tax=Methylophilus medardicus TaxID=2588534 RepID=A0A5B8CR85_9PROT|nr:MerR family transcriptional regulator [Methylophilus medardicus]QDC43763.1 MerR family transcriptional regulator [Methylophilus medardicus]QDC48770.1 MerR family transcriptional regulator [Methylophilus medardicus]QDC52475.1 MerR family transcriptional regulator [Methylophilus medardicus]